MTTPAHGQHPVPEQPSAPRDADELALIAAGFPAFRLWREIRLDRTRYIAQGISLDSHPHTVITHDLGELRVALTDGQQAPQAARL